MKSIPYLKYKSSGIEWLGDITEHWEVKRLKYKSTINNDSLPETVDSNYKLLYVDISNLNPINGIVKKKSIALKNAYSRAS